MSELRAPSLVIVATSFNRRALTLAALRRADASAARAGVKRRIVLVDADSSDGTSSAVRQEFDDAKVVSVDADHYWARGMRVGMQRALVAPADFVLWLNDDTMLYESAVGTLLDTAQGGDSSAVVVVGAIQDPHTGAASYGGWLTTGRRGLRLEPAGVEARAVRCDTLNGNAALISREAVNRVGLLDAAFSHGLADWDYGLRARRLRVPVIQAPGFVGTCSRNDPAGTWRDPMMPLGRRIEMMRSPKGLPPTEWVRFQLRHGGIGAPGNILRPWMGLLRDAFQSKTSRCRSRPGPRGQESTP